MPYMGKVDVKASDIKRFSVTGSTSATHALSWTAPSEQALIITINGVKQHDGSYTISGTPTTITLSSALVATDEMEVIGINDIGQTNTVAQDSIVTDMIRDDAVTTAKIADNQITTAKIANDQITTAKIADDQITSAKLDTNIAIDGDLTANSLYVGGYESNWVDFTPEFTFFTAGNETKYGKYIRFKDFILIKVYLVIGSTTVVSNGFSLTPPFPVDTTFQYYAGTALAIDVSSGNDYNGIVRPFASNRLRPMFYTSLNALSLAAAGSPFTWDTGDILSLEATGILA